MTSDPTESAPGSVSGDEATHPLPDIPLASIQPVYSKWRAMFGGTRMWIATAACILLAIVLCSMAFLSSGTLITIDFQDGYGIKAGDTLQFRGIDVGQVTTVDVNAELSGVSVQVTLQQNATELARQGSQFWIERPQFGLARVSGLETVVGAKYIGVIPGDPVGGLQTQFTGIESPPVIRDSSGTAITVEFREGHGIDVGTVVRHLGMVVGEVTGIELAERLESVRVHLRLTESAARVARAGSLFWIERPELGLSGIRGLETLISGPYIDFRPGPPEGPRVLEFQGVNQAPAAARLPNGLELILTSNQQRALTPGVPVTYRGLKVGHVVSVSLASDASSVQARVYIQPDYKALVRINSRFWSNIGIDADLGVKGFQLKTDSLQSLAEGSIGFATPVDLGRAARTGDRFECAKNYDAEWLEWRPAIAVGEQMLPAGKRRPSPIRVTLGWDRRQLTWTRSKQRQGWVLLRDDGLLYGLPRYLQPDENALPDSAGFEMSGQAFPFDPDRFSNSGALATYRITEPLSQHLRWSLDDLRRPETPEECLIVADPQAAMAPLSANQIVEQQADRWLIASAVSFDASLDGACVISRSDAALLGFLDLARGQAEVVLVDTNR